MAVISSQLAVARTFRPLHPRSPHGPHIHVLEGDPESGPSLALFRYRRDYTGSGRLHTHTSRYRSWLIEGAMKHWGEASNEQTAEVLHAGSYWSQPGDTLHADNCVSERCTAYVLFDGPIDAHFPDAPESAGASERSK
ncbi:MAG: hypothetical protein AAGA56_11485 [Myxococcota bacterium]